MSPQNFNTIAVNQIYVNENPMVFWVGSQPIFNTTWGGSGTLSSPTCELYYKNTNKSNDNLTGSTSISGRVQTTKQLNLDTPGDWELYMQVTDGSIPRIKALRILVKAKGVK